jgi:hypothetical protein
MVVVAFLAAKLDGGPPGDCDNAHIAAHEIGRQFRQAINVAICPTVFDGNVLTDEVTALLQTFAERSQLSFKHHVGRSAVQEANCRHRLLRARRERPSRRAAQQRDELAPSHVEHGLPPA